MHTLKKYLSFSILLLIFGCSSYTETDRIIFISEKDGNPEIYSMEKNGSDPQRLTNSSRSENNPKLSFNGKYLSFLVEKNSIKELYMLEMEENGKQIQISEKGLDVEDFFWSPNSQGITYKAKDSSEIHDIYLYDLVKDSTNKVTNNSSIEKLGNWSPDGEWIVYSVIKGDEDKVGIFKKNPSGVDEVRLTENFEDHNPLWSPDGKRIAFLSTRGSDDIDIYTLDIENNEERNITASQGNDFDFSWDPDGKRIVFVSEREDNPEIFVIDVTLKQDPIRLTDNDSLEYSPIWKDNKIIFISNSDGDKDVYSMTPSDGSNQKRLSETKQNETEIYW
ncbi:MAG: PD40 domain-containing protein [Chloroflexi bacterium]|nr:PD40 domain-containing protein [Chloroflexota bacterium]|tara:strand:- start:66 stop:1067 length:1002 start_codon:yes stop_codon:yes gene_type:complete